MKSSPNERSFSVPRAHQSLRNFAYRSVLFAAMAIAMPSFAAVNSGSTGADGALAPSVNTEVQLPPSGILNYTTINIPAGVTVTFKRNVLNTPAYLLASGDVTIAGTLDARGLDGKAAGSYGDGNQADDGLPGKGGPGGFDGGRGGRADAASTPAIIRGGAGLGPGGGAGGIEGGDGSGCAIGAGYFPRVGLGAAYAFDGSDAFSRPYCGNVSTRVAKAYGSAAMQPLIGGSGGGGGRGGVAFPGSGGGGGGGALLIASSGALTVTSTGSIDTTGGDAGGVAGNGSGDSGGGGSGGAIRLLATTIAGSGRLSALGGCINASNARRQSCAASPYNSTTYTYNGASPGRIRLEAENITFAGTVDPGQVVGTPSAVFVSNIPSLRISTVGGTAVPASPTGVADVTFPATQTGPVTVEFQTTNVPTGSTVLLRLVPAYGNVVETLSPAISGSTASGTAAVSVTLPQGPSTLLAITSFTVTVAMGNDLSRFAQNERVEKVELVATLGRPAATARLITVSGKSYEVPVAVLHMVGQPG